MYLTNPFLPPLISNFCSSENSTLLPRHAATRLSKRLTTISNNKINESRRILKLEVIVTVTATVTVMPPLFCAPIVRVACRCPDSYPHYYRACHKRVLCCTCRKRVCGMWNTKLKDLIKSWCSANTSVPQTSMLRRNCYF